MKWKNFYLDNHCNFITSTVNGRERILCRNDIAEIIAKHIRISKDKYGFKLAAYVLMPDHWHILAFFKYGKDCLAFNRDFKRFSSNEIIKYLLGRKEDEILTVFKRYANGLVNYSLWKEQARVIPLSTAKKVEQKIQYIHMNPVKKGLVINPEDYQFSSARYYLTGEKGILDIDELDFIAV
jgi:putative transposase